MATEHSRKNLGSLFGGEIMSINYNFQSGSEASTCTLTIISENNEYNVPKMNEKVHIPPFGLEMIVLETSLRQDSKFTTLQVELIDSMSEILDREMVFIWGTHTDMRGNLSSNGYLIDKTLFLSPLDYPKNTRFSRNLARPTTSRNFNKNFGNGVNVIGFGRITLREEASRTITIDPSAEELIDGNTFVEEKRVVIDAFELNRTLTTDKTMLLANHLPLISLGYDPEQAELKFGYTASDLFKLFLSKGISFESNDERFLSDENIMFSDSGSFRKVLSSVLSKIGRSFYVDPFTQKIHIVTNGEIASINTNLNNMYLNFENTESAEQLTLTKSIKNVEATHHFIKGQATKFVGENSSSTSVAPKAKKHVLYKLSGEELFKELDLKEADIKFAKIVAPFYNRTQDTEATDKLVFALGETRPFELNGTYYGPDEYRYSDVNLLDKNRGNWFSVINSDDRYNFFDFDPSISTDAIRLLINGKNAISVSEANYLAFIDSYMTLLGGVYISSPISKRRLDRRQYLDTELKSGEYVIAIADANEFIDNVPELSFLQKLRIKAANKTGGKIKNIRVKDLAARLKILQGDDEEEDNTSDDEDDEGNPLGSRFHVIAVRDMKYFNDNGISEDEGEGFSERIHKNFYLFTSTQGRFLVKQDNKSTSKAEDIAKRCEQAFDDTGVLDGVKEKLIVKYMVVGNDKSSGDQQDTSSPEINFLRTDLSNVKQFASRQFSVFSSEYEEANHFIKNINTINPEFEGPFITTDIKYFRPPERADFDMDKGVSSISVSMGAQGISTSIRYSSIKFAQIDTSLSREFLGSSTTDQVKRFSQNAFVKNRIGS